MFGSVLSGHCLLLLLPADDSPDPAAPTTPTATEGLSRAATGRFDEQDNKNLEAWGQFWDQQGVQARKDMPNPAVRMAHLLGLFSGVLQARGQHLVYKTQSWAFAAGGSVKQCSCTAVRLWIKALITPACWRMARCSC